MHLLSQVHNNIFNGIPLLRVSSRVGPSSGRTSDGIAQNNYITVVVSCVCRSAGDYSRGDLLYCRVGQRVGDADRQGPIHVALECFTHIVTNVWYWQRLLDNITKSNYNAWYGKYKTHSHNQTGQPMTVYSNTEGPSDLRSLERSLLYQLIHWGHTFRCCSQFVHVLWNIIIIIIIISSSSSSSSIGSSSVCVITFFQ
jgi:hypothetical protein